MSLLKSLARIVYGRKRDGSWHNYDPWFRRTGMPVPHPQAGLMRRWHNGAWEYRALTDKEIAEEAERQIDAVL